MSENIWVQRVGSAGRLRNVLLLAGLVGTMWLAGCDGVGQQQAADAATTHAAQTAAATQPDIAEPSTEEKLIIGLYDDYPPLTFRDKNGTLQGFDIDLARAVMEKIGEKYEFKSIDWGSKEDLLNNSRRIDMLWSGVHLSDERRKIFDFTDSYMENPTVIVVAPGSDIQVADDIGGKTVGIQEGFFSVPFVKRWSGSQGGVGRLVENPENSLLLAELLQGKLDAVVIDRTQILYFLRNTPGKFRIIPGDFVKSDIAIALRKNDGELRSKLNRGLVQVRDDGTYQQIYEKWFGKQ